MPLWVFLSHNRCKSLLIYLRFLLTCVRSRLTYLTTGEEISSNGNEFGETDKVSGISPDAGLCCNSVAPQVCA